MKDIFIVAKCQSMNHKPWSSSTWNLEDLKDSLTLAESAVIVQYLFMSNKLWLIIYELYKYPGTAKIISQIDRLIKFEIQL